MGYQALYRQLRPQEFEDIVGQKHVTRTLSNAIKNQRIAHAYLFSGPRGVGKTSTARILAKAVNCDSGPTAKPCGTCRLCTSINTNSSMDVLEIDAASNNGVDEIRDLREKVKYSPTDCRYKVYIIDEVHMLSTAAFNALLKTLEEPPAHVIFILATTEVHKIPATILSRCQRFDFHRISVEDIIKHLNDIAATVDIRLEEKAAQLIARAADGALRDAISILDQCLSYSSDKVSVEDTANLLGTVGDEKFLQLTEYIYNTNIVAAFELVQDVYQKGKDLEQFVSDYLQYLKILLQLESGIEDAYLILDSADKAKHQANKLGKAKLLHLIHCMVTVSNEIKYASNKAIILEMGLVESQYFLGDTIYELKARIDDLEQRLERQEGVVPPPLKVSEQQGSPKEEQILVSPKSEQPMPAANKRKPISKQKLEPEHELKKRQEQELNVKQEQKQGLKDTEPEIAVSNIVPPDTKMNPGVAADETEGDKEDAKVVQFAIVQRKWAQVLEGVRESSVIVHALLREANPLSLTEGVLSLQFANDFHQEEMMKSDKRQVLESVLENIFGAKLSIKGQKGERATAHATAQPDEVSKPSEDSTDAIPDEDSGLQQVLEIFGGKLIERKDAK